MSADEMLLMERTRRRLDEKNAANIRARATDAAMHLRMAIALLEPLSRSPEMDRVAEHLDEAATLLIAALDRNVAPVSETDGT